MSHVRTVLGDLDPAELGITYSHEHVIIAGGKPVELNPDFLLDDVDKATDELAAAKALGLGCVVDAMPADCGRDVVRLAEVSRRTGVHVIAATGLLSISLIGFGLLMAGLFKSANQLNTWSGLLLLPVIAPAFAIGLPTPKIVGKIAEALPTGSAAKILMNSMAHERVFSNQMVSFAIIVAWGVLAFGLLLWQLSRRQA